MRSDFSLNTTAGRSLCWATSLPLSLGADLARATTNTVTVVVVTVVVTVRCRYRCPTSRESSGFVASRVPPSKQGTT